MTIWKFPIKPAGETWLQMPLGAHVLTAQYQDETLFVWALVDPLKPVLLHKVLSVGTGWSFDSQGWRYVSTVQDRGGFVWHVFAPEPEAI
jgi:hypothetical protein